MGRSPRKSSTASIHPLGRAFASAQSDIMTLEAFGFQVWASCSFAHEMLIFLPLCVIRSNIARLVIAAALNAPNGAFGSASRPLVRHAQHSNRFLITCRYDHQLLQFGCGLALVGRFAA